MYFFIIGISHFIFFIFFFQIDCRLFCKRLGSEGKCFKNETVFEPAQRQPPCKLHYTFSSAMSSPLWLPASSRATLSMVVRGTGDEATLVGSHGYIYPPSTSSPSVAHFGETSPDLARSFVTRFASVPPPKTRKKCQALSADQTSKSEQPVEYGKTQYVKLRLLHTLHSCSSSPNGVLLGGYSLPVRCTFHGACATDFSQVLYVCGDTARHWGGGRGWGWGWGGTAILDILDYAAPTPCC